MSQVEESLKKYGLSVTLSRKKILGMFVKANGALSHASIEKQSAEEFDRVTIYRTLQTFVEKGIIHTIPTPDNSVIYALCKDTCKEGIHHDNHVHFMCDVCGNTFCLNRVIVPEITLPIGFKGTQTDLLVTGKCVNCN